jgi:hypothetical protein
MLSCTVCLAGTSNTSMSALIEPDTGQRGAAHLSVRHQHILVIIVHTLTLNPAL